MYVIVGASGFLGSYFIKNILEHTDEEILAVARMTKEDADRRIHWVSCDISNPDEVTILNRAFLSKISGKKLSIWQPIIIQIWWRSIHNLHGM